MTDTAPAPHPLLKMALELGPLGLFLLANARPQLFAPLTSLVLPQSLASGEKAGIFTATIMLMIGVLIALVISRSIMRRWPVMPVVTAIAVLFFGALTLYFQDVTFIKMKPTFLNMVFGAILLGGLAFGKPFLPHVMDAAFKLTDEGWHKLTLRWGIFFFVLAGANELVWRSLDAYQLAHGLTDKWSNDYWVSYKVYGSPVLTFLFIVTQMPLILRHDAKSETVAVQDTKENPPV